MLRDRPQQRARSSEIAEIVGRALALGLLPAFGLAVAIGMVLSLRALDRLSEVNRRIQRIVAGDLRERLPTRGGNDPFDQLAVSVNRMLGEIEALIQEIAGVGDDIAHDLRTPLTRVRVRLERGREHAATLDGIAGGGRSGDRRPRPVVGHHHGAVAHRRDRAQPPARGLQRRSRSPRSCARWAISTSRSPRTSRSPLRVEAADEATVHGDRDLLFEAVANLVDNAREIHPAGRPRGARIAAPRRRDRDPGDATPGPASPRRNAKR